MIKDRIQSLDELRGLAVLGMFAVNILAFAMPYHAFFDPGAASHFADIDQALFHLTSIAFEGTFRAIFCVLFGVGLMLQYDRLCELRGAQSASEHQRARMAWLMVIGLLDAYVLLWFGDILFTYGLVGLLLLRMISLKASHLMLVATLLLALLALQNLMFGEDLAAAENQNINETFNKTGTEIANGYLSAWPERAALAFAMHLSILWRGGWEVLAFMLIGMAACRVRASLLTRPAWQYATLAVSALTLGACVNAWEIERARELDAPMLTQLLWSYDLGRLSLALSIASGFMLLVRLDLIRGVRKCLAATGRMALTNYLMQSLVCLLVFVELGFFGKLRYHELMCLVAGMWVIQVCGSVLWLRYLPTGPAEWLWRSLANRSSPRHHSA